MTSTEVGGTELSAVRWRFPSATAWAIASPSAVPSRPRWGGEGRSGFTRLPRAANVQKHEQRHDEQREQDERRLEAHRRLCFKKTASERSQSPEVERTTWRTPTDMRTRATSRRSAAAA